MDKHAWVKEFAGAITLCDTQGIVLELNDRAVQLFHDDGGRELIGKNLLDCHPEAARKQLCEMMEKQATNIYTTEKDGVKKLIYQAPWYRDGEYAGFLEISFELPAVIPNFLRD